MTEGEAKIFVGGITGQTTREELLEFFSQFGRVVGVSVPWEHSARRNRGFAFVTFANFDVADRVCQQRYFDIQQHKIEVKHAVPRAMMMMQHDMQKQKHAFLDDEISISQIDRGWGQHIPSPEPIHIGNPEPETSKPSIHFRCLGQADSNGLKDSVEFDIDQLIEQAQVPVRSSFGHLGRSQSSGRPTPTTVSFTPSQSVDSGWDSRAYSSSMASRLPASQANSTASLEYLHRPSSLESIDNISSQLDAIRFDPCSQEVKVFIGGITSETTREELLAYFSQFGKVTGVSVPWDHGARRNRGFAFVTFASSSVADQVCAQRFFAIGHHKVEVKHAVPRSVMMAQHDELQRKVSFAKPLGETLFENQAQHETCTPPRSLVIDRPSPAQTLSPAPISTSASASTMSLSTPLSLVPPPSQAQLGRYGFDGSSMDAMSNSMPFSPTFATFVPSFNMTYSSPPFSSTSSFSASQAFANSSPLEHCDWLENAGGSFKGIPAPSRPRKEEVHHPYRT